GGAGLAVAAGAAARRDPLGRLLVGTQDACGARDVAGRPRGSAPTVARFAPPRRRRARRARGEHVEGTRADPRRAAVAEGSDEDARADAEVGPARGLRGGPRR